MKLLLRLGLDLVHPRGADVIHLHELQTHNKNFLLVSILQKQKNLYGYYHFNFIISESSVNDGFFAIATFLHLVQGVPIYGDGRLDLSTIRSFLFKLHARLELDHYVLERRIRRQHVLITLLLQRHHRRNGIAHLPRHQTHT